MSPSSKLFSAIAQDLSDRQRQVIEGRFGVGNEKEPKTLEAIGGGFGVTRERVRQIEASALDILEKSIAKNAPAQNILKDGKKYLKEKGGISPKDACVAHLARSHKELDAHQLDLLLAASGAFFVSQEDDDFAPLYYLDKASLFKAKSFVAQWVSALSGKKSAVAEGASAYRKEFGAFVKRKNVLASHAENYANVSKNIRQNPYGDVGLADWAEINPRAVRDRIYLVLKKNGAPAHFTDIARLINEAHFETDRVALASTVHNELIKDSRFVLVGRGTYGLSEQGYVPGTAKDIIARILHAQGPLSSREVMLAVKKERFFKENTILVNLQNKESFIKKVDGKYHVREV